VPKKWFELEVIDVGMTNVLGGKCEKMTASHVTNNVERGMNVLGSKCAKTRFRVLYKWRKRSRHGCSEVLQLTLEEGDKCPRRKVCKNGISCITPMWGEDVRGGDDHEGSVEER